MAEKKVIAVLGATGAQGGGMARAILADPNGGFAVRAITRAPRRKVSPPLVPNAPSDRVTPNRTTYFGMAEKTGGERRDARGSGT